MDELKKILAKKAEDRTPADLEYLENHKSELSDDQNKQLSSEETILEEIEHDFSKKTLLDPNETESIQREFNTEIKDLGEGMMRAVVSSEVLDRHGEQIDMKGMDIKKYMQNPIISYMHDHSEPSVGRTHKLTKTKDGQLIAVFEWAKDINEKARVLYELYKEKFQFAFSIEFIPLEIDGVKYTKSEMIGFAPVLVGANPEALLLAKNKGIDITLLGIDNKREVKYKLEDILKKEINDLTVGEIAFLKEEKNLAKLSDEDKTKFATVLDDPEDGDDAGKDDADADKTEKNVEQGEILASLKAITDSVEKLSGDVEEMKTADPVVIKNIAGQNNPKNFAVKGKDVSKELKFLYFARGLQSGNFKQYLDAVGKDAMNTTDTSDVVPPNEFIAEVERLEEQYGVARQFANVRRSAAGNGIHFLQGDDDLEIFDTAESGVKKSTKLTYAPLLLTWRKYAGILPITDELAEDSAIDLWNDATTRFARAFTRKEDEIIFTRLNGGGNLFPGILHVAGTNSVVINNTGGYEQTFEGLDYDTLSRAIWGVPSPSEANGRFFFNREMLGVVQRIKDGDNRPVWQPAMADGTPATILGKPYSVVEVMPNLDATDDNTPFAIFGDLKYATLGERTGLNIIVRDTGTVGDPDEVDQDTNTINLFTQDVQAMRAVKRMNGIVRFPAAFSVIRTANSGGS